MSRMVSTSGQMAVASGHPLATQAAIHILQAGGSAVDAAIAADACMGFIEPTSTGVGGDVMAVVAQGSEVGVINGSGRAGRGLDPSAIADNGHGFVPSLGGHAVTVPGAVAAWAELHDRYGQLRWDQILQPAITAATDGDRVGVVGSRLWRIAAKRLDPAAQSIYLNGGSAPASGDTWKNPVLGRTLGGIATDGPDAFYRGPLASAIADAVTSAGGAMDAADLAAHRSAWVEPVRANAR